MSDKRWDPNKVRVAVARDLRAIESLAAELHWQMYATTRDGEPGSGKMLGGDALHALSPVAPVADWEAQYEAYEEAAITSDVPLRSNHGGHDYAADQFEDHPLNELERWTRVIREERNQPTGLKATISREVDYLSKNLAWMTRTSIHDEPEWPEVFEIKADLRAVVQWMESLLSMGSRLDRSATACLRVVNAGGKTCGGQLVRRTLRRRTCEHVDLATKIAEWLGAPVSDSLRALLWYRPDMAKTHKDCDQGGRDDVYRCLECEQTYTSAEYWLAVKSGYEREAAG